MSDKFYFDLDRYILRPRFSPYNGAVMHFRLCFDGHSGEAWIEEDDPGDNHVTAREWHGHYLTADIGIDGMYPTTADLAAYLNGQEGQALLWRMFFGHKEKWDGSNWIGWYSDEAQQAVADLQDGIAALPSVAIECWHADDWLQNVSADAYGITGVTSDEALSEIATTIVQDAWASADYHAVVDRDEVLAVLKGWRDELRDD